MSNIELEKYLKAYSEILEAMVELHNRHMIYKFRKGRDSASNVRKAAKKLVILTKLLQKTAQSSYIESRKNTMERLARLREERAYRKANPKKAGRPKKNEPV